MAVLHVTVVALCFSERYICGCSDVPMDMGSLAARPHSAPRGRVWDVAIEPLVTQEFN